MPRQSLGVVTVTYNSGPFLLEFIASCERQTMCDFRVYCVDNKSSDDTVAMLDTIDDERWRICVNPVNRGVAAGNNQGIVRALRDNCEWVLLLNNDTKFSPDFFERLVDSCTANEWSVVVPKIHFDTPVHHIWYGGGGFRRSRAYSGYHVAMGEPDVGQCDTRGYVAYAPTCSMLVHRTVFEAVGLMDEAYFVYFDDTDFCWRLKRERVRIGYNPEATVVHKVGGSTGGDRKPFTVGYTARNRLYYVRKHFGSIRALVWTPVFLSFYLVRYLTGRWGFSCLRASFRGSFSYRRMRATVPELSTELHRVPAGTTEGPWRQLSTRTQSCGRR